MSLADQTSLYFPSIKIFRGFCQKEEELLLLFHKMLEGLLLLQSHHMCLATILKYSPVTMKRLKNLIRGREAYIVTQVPHNDDIYVSDYLDVPVMCPEPDTAFLYSSKSGSKRIFADAAVTTPPGEFDVYSLPQVQYNTISFIP